jgi:hypothetical protein
MAGAVRLETTLLAGAPALLAFHARELPQRDDLCGAFCGALALRAAGVAAPDGQPLDQDEVAVAAGSVVAGARQPGVLPAGEPGRRDYRLAIPMVDDEARSGTTAAGIVQALAELSAGQVVPVPLEGPWTATTLGAMFDLAATLERPVSMLANLATRHLWGAGATRQQLLAYLLDGATAGPPPDWDVGHFACIVARVDGPGGSAYALADTYPSLGTGGVHMQPQERLAAAIARPDMPAGGVVVAACAEDAQTVRDGARALGLVERIWDNGTVAAPSVLP